MSRSAGKGFDGGAVESAGVAFADLHAAVAEEEGLGGDDEAVLVEGVARDKEVGDAGFIFQGDEVVAFGGARARTSGNEFLSEMDARSWRGRVPPAPVTTPE